MDGLDNQLTRESSHADAGRLDLGLGHPLAGPVYVTGAKPGDLLEVELLAYETDDFGTTAVIPGFGYLADLFTDPYLVKWEIAGGLARSAELPGVAVPEDAFAGVIGVAPSRERLDAIRRREEAMAERGQPVADSLPEGAKPREAADGLRTIPPRETRREPRRPPARRRQPAVASRRRSRRVVLDRRPPLRPGRRRGLRNRDRDRGRGHRPVRADRQVLPAGPASRPSRRRAVPRGGRSRRPASRSRRGWT